MLPAIVLRRIEPFEISARLNACIVSLGEEETKTANEALPKVVCSVAILSKETYVLSKQTKKQQKK